MGEWERGFPLEIITSICLRCVRFSEENLSIGKRGVTQILHSVQVSYRSLISFFPNTLNYFDLTFRQSYHVP